jgi:hypothetical protein
MLGTLYGKRFGSKIARANRKEGDRVGTGQSTEQAVEGNDLHESERMVDGRVQTIV